MYKIAISGSMGCGKSTVSNIIKSKYEVFNCDDEAKKCYSDPKYMNTLKDILEIDYNNHGNVDYKKISDIIFNNENKRLEVEKVIHKYILEKINELSNEINFVEIALLYELGWEKYFDSIILVDTNFEIALERVLKNRNITLDEAMKRLSLQYTDNINKKYDYIIHNDSDYDTLQKQVNEIVRKIEVRYGVKGK